MYITIIKLYTIHKYLYYFNNGVMSPYNTLNNLRNTVKEKSRNNFSIPPPFQTLGRNKHLPNKHPNPNTVSHAKFTISQVLPNNQTIFSEKNTKKKPMVRVLSNL